MSNPIDPTPVLSGEDAAALLHAVANPDRSESRRAFLRHCDAVFAAHSPGVGGTTSPAKNPGEKEEEIPAEV